jgi:hypothetical protein
MTNIFVNLDETDLEMEKYTQIFVKGKDKKYYKVYVKPFITYYLYNSTDKNDKNYLIDINDKNIDPIHYDTNRFYKKVTISDVGTLQQKSKQKSKQKTKSKTKSKSKQKSKTKIIKKRRFKNKK